MNKPNFLCVGAPKCGTSSLFNILKQHSQVFMTKKKELHFFDRQNNFEKGADWYFSSFKKSDNYIAKGEITPNYLYTDVVPERIFKILGSNAKLIFMLRNPADRAFSHYKMQKGRGLEKNNFKYLINLEALELKKDEYQLNHLLIKKGFYDVQIERYLQFFPIENMFFILFEEDFLQNRKQTIKNLFKFLQVNENESIGLNIKSTPGVNSKSTKADKILNTAHPINQFAKKIIPSKKLRTNIKYFLTKLNQKPTANKLELEEMRPFLINDIYKESILNLENIIERDLSSWYKI